MRIFKRFMVRTVTTEIRHIFRVEPVLFQWHTTLDIRHHDHRYFLRCIRAGQGEDQTWHFLIPAADQDMILDVFYQGAALACRTGLTIFVDPSPKETKQSRDTQKRYECSKGFANSAEWKNITRMARTHEHEHPQHGIPEINGRKLIIDVHLPCILGLKVLNHLHDTDHGNKETRNDEKENAATIDPQNDPVKPRRFRRPHIPQSIISPALVPRPQHQANHQPRCKADNIFR